MGLEFPSLMVWHMKGSSWYMVYKLKVLVEKGQYKEVNCLPSSANAWVQLASNC